MPQTKRPAKAPTKKAPAPAADHTATDDRWSSLDRPGQISSGEDAFGTSAAFEPGRHNVGDRSYGKYPEWSDKK